MPTKQQKTWNAIAKYKPHDTFRQFYYRSNLRDVLVDLQS